MASVPKEICGICRVTQQVVKALGNNVKKNYKIYAFFSIIIIELSSLIVQNKVSQDLYALKLFPILTYINYIVIFLAIILQSKKLAFCLRQKLIISFLVIYYITNILFTIYPLCWSSYQIWIYTGILGVILILFYLTVKK